MLKKIKKYKYLISIISIILIIILVILRTNKLKEDNLTYTMDKSNEIIINEEENIQKENEEVRIKIDIKGQINNPGVYELSENSRIIDAINIAGGLTDNANTSLINLSKKLEDGMVIIIYSNEEVANSNVKEVETVFKIIEKECDCPNIKNDGCVNTELDNTSDTTKEKEENVSENISQKININTASSEQLMTLPSIGQAKANAIIEYRKENKFTTIEDIKNVSGIGDSLFEKIKEYITV